MFVFMAIPVKNYLSLCEIYVQRFPLDANGRTARCIGQIPLMGDKCMGKKLERAPDNFATEQAIVRQP